MTRFVFCLRYKMPWMSVPCPPGSFWDRVVPFPRMVSPDVLWMSSEWAMLKHPLVGRFTVELAGRLFNQAPSVGPLSGAEQSDGMLGGTEKQAEKTAPAPTAANTMAPAATSRRIVWSSASR